MAGEPNLADQFKKALDGMTPTQRGMAAAITLTVMLALAAIGIWAAQEPLDVLFSNLPPQDANQIVEKLKKTPGMAYKLSSDQRTVYVPKDRVGELRIQFAGEGLPHGEGIGFEKLETPSLMATDFTQKVIHRRALEGELSKTIKSIQQVSDATVHITPAGDSPFVSEKEDAKASVLLKLKGSRMLPEENTQAIVNLVAASVEGLKPENVVVIDQSSRILSRSGKDPMIGASDSQKKLQRAEEDYLVRQITELLEPVVGPGKVRATAHVDLDFDKVKINEERFNPQEQVERSIQQKEEKSTKRDAGAGAPGTPSNVAPATGGAQAGVLENVDKKDTTTNFEISKKTTQTDQAPGSIKRMSLAVVVDHTTTWEKDAKGDPAAKLTPRSAEEMKKLRDQVASAVGVRADRGDQITVENMPFASLSNPKEEAEAKKQWWFDQIAKLAPALIYLIMGLAVFFLVVLPMLKKLSAAISRPSPLRVEGPDGEFGVGGAPKITKAKSLEELQAEIENELNMESANVAPEAQRRQLIKKRLNENAAGDPEAMAHLIRSWLLEDGR